MYHFDKDPEKIKKEYYKTEWKLEEEVRQTEHQFVNQEMQMWDDLIKRKAQEALVTRTEEVPAHLLKEYD